MLRMINRPYPIYDPTLPKISSKERRLRGRKYSGKGRRQARPASEYQIVTRSRLPWIF